jgi:hypothetical protein
MPTQLDRYETLLVLVALRYAQANCDDLVSCYQTAFDGDAGDNPCRVEANGETEAFAVPDDRYFSSLAARFETALVPRGDL